MAMDFVLQVTVEELVLENLLDSRGTLTFELSRGTKVGNERNEHTKCASVVDFDGACDEALTCAADEFVFVHHV